MVHWKSSVMSVMHTSALCREHGSPHHLGQNIRIYQVVNGVRHMIQNFDHVIDIRQWYAPPRPDARVRCSCMV